ncbi:hypothetical protein D3I12_12560 [Enterococcus faecalis]|nr:hypothetical protein [Enterococcus faecalis]
MLSCHLKPLPQVNVYFIITNLLFLVNFLLYLQIISLPTQYHFHDVYAAEIDDRYGSLRYEQGFLVKAAHFGVWR